LADQELAAGPGRRAWDESAANALLNRVEAGQSGAPMADQPAWVVIPEVAAQWAPLVSGLSMDVLGLHEAEWAHPGRMNFQSRRALDRALPGALVAAAISVAAAAEVQRATLKLHSRVLPV